MKPTTVAFTLDTYSHVVPGLQEAAAKAFDEVLYEYNRIYLGTKKSGL